MTALSLQGTIIHAHKRYNAFEELSTAVHRTLPVRSILIFLLPGRVGVILGAIYSITKLCHRFVCVQNPP